MRILWVKAGGLLPLDTGGKIRSYHILRELARRHEVTFFTFYGIHRGDVHRDLERLVARVVLVPLPLPAPRSFEECTEYARNLLTLRAYNIVKYCRPEVAERLSQLLQKEEHDVIVCDFLIASGVIPWDFRCPKVLFTHNVEATIWQRYYQVAKNPILKAVAWREYRTMARAERKYAARADHVLAVSEDDRDLFARFLDSRKISVIPTGVDVQYFQPSSARADPNSLVFTGSMDWLPNEDAVFYFVEQILPRIRSHVAKAKLVVVGRRPSQRLHALADRSEAVQITGEVADIRPYVQSASVYVVPLRVGGGTRLKIFEAMAMGKAVVSTSVGAEGLPVQHNDNIILANGAEEFARSVVELLRDSARRYELGHAARQLVEQNYSWSSASAQFDAVLCKVVSESGHTHPNLVAALGQVTHAS
jgi:sugar transferase (PEP-CTERM/EpsH1 system associated)